MTTAVSHVCFEHKPRADDIDPAPVPHIILLLAGTTGAGKHTIARELSSRIGTSYIDFNQEEGIDTIHSGSPAASPSLSDIARAALKACASDRKIGIITHPLLLRSHRDSLRAHIKEAAKDDVMVRMVYLIGGSERRSSVPQMEREREEVPVEGEEEGCLVVDTRKLSVGDVVRIVGDWVWE